MQRRTLAGAPGGRRWCIFLLGLACSATTGPHALTWRRLVTGTNADLVAVECTPTGVYAVDGRGGRHDLRGHDATSRSAQRGLTARQGDLVYRIHGNQLQRSTDGGATWTRAVLGVPAATVSYGRDQPQRIAIAPGGTRVYMLGRYTAISNSLEDDYAYLLRSDDAGRSWTEVWTGPNVGPMGGGRRRDPDVGAALVVLADGALVVNAARDGLVLVSRDVGRTFEARRTPERECLSDLWVGPDGVLRGVGHRGTIVVSGDGARTFTREPSGVTDDLAAVTGCDGTAWVVGAHGTVVTADTRRGAERDAR